ncbi:MAG: LytTR family DNA-binding domain-containing protein [Candidatus Pseudobacter hemicellulosilyticus]|uniref:LytTR family DNA-binding domain-containing protein n=1 Tax=Candidatus Pseudobacter hemicellulosilyticus TaxID=3121375 RepID=A0AAJ5WU50_9BACT|nr:MAG: LytTR family DNA-binding domain-containing protein [Pseudobacter sp.]
MQLFFFIKDQGRYVRVDFSDILFIEARSNYVQVVTRSRTYMCLVSMRQIEQLLPADAFCRVHRSYIVCLGNIHSFDKERIYMEERTVPIGDRYRESLFQRITLVRCRQSAPLLTAETAGEWL